MCPTSVALIGQEQQLTKCGALAVTRTIPWLFLLLPPWDNVMKFQGRHECFPPNKLWKTVAPSAGHVVIWVYFCLTQNLCCSLLNINVVMKIDQKQSFISFSLSLCCFVTHGVNVGNIPGQRKTTPSHSQPQQTAAATAFICSTPDTTVHHVPVIWILVLAGRVEKMDKGRKEEGSMKASLHWGVHWASQM